MLASSGERLSVYCHCSSSSAVICLRRASSDALASGTLSAGGALGAASCGAAAAGGDGAAGGGLLEQPTAVTATADTRPITSLFMEVPLLEHQIIDDRPSHLRSSAALQRAA